MICPFTKGENTVALEKTAPKTTTTTKRSAPPPPPEPEQTDRTAAVVPCEVGLDAGECGLNEVCAPPNNRSRSGVCACAEGFARDDKGGKCVSESAATSPPPPQGSNSMETFCLVL